MGNARIIFHFYNLNIMLNINKLSIQVAVHELAVANHVTDEQMASYIFRNFYTSLNKMEISAKIKRHSVAITNLALQL